MENFTRLASGLDVVPLVYQLGMQQHLYDEITARQDTPNSPHIDTRSVFLRWCPTQTVEAAFTEIPAVDYPAYELLPEALKLVDVLRGLAEGEEVGRVLVVDLKPGGFITPHADEGDYADYYERFHVCLRSADGNKFYVQTGDEYGEFVHMKTGEAWWFNHKRPHWVFNASNQPRVHLIVDMVSPKFRRERGD